MAITIQAQLAKKVPIPGADYSSQQASITVTAEVTDLNQVVAEAQRLYRLAEQAVDAQLASNGHAAPTVSSTATKPVTASPAPTPPARASRPYAGNHRQPAPVTDSQLRFLDRLIRDTGTDPNVILQQHQIGSLRDLTSKAASGLIDSLRGQGAVQ